MKKLGTILIWVFVITAIVYSLWFIRLFTPGTKVIKEYPYAGNIKQFIAHIKSLSEKDSTFTFKITDTTGTISTGHSYYMDIKLKHNGDDIEYNLSFDQNKSDSTSDITLGLVLAYDRTTNTGGYGGPGTEPLIKLFENDILGR